MSHAPDCSGYFLEWAGMVRHDVAPLVPLLPREVQGKLVDVGAEAEFWHLYRCSRCYAAFLSSHTPDLVAAEKLGLRWTDL